MTIDLVMQPGSPVQLQISEPAPIHLDLVTDGDAVFGEDPRIGELSALTTEIKSTIVAAINELNMPGVSWRSLYNNAKAG